MAERRATTVGKNEGGSTAELDAAGDEEEGGGGAEEAEGDVDEEDEAPAAGGEEEAADRGAERQPYGLGRALEPDGPAERLGGHDEHDDGQAVGLEHRRSHRLQRPEGDQCAEVGGQPAQQ